MSSLGVSRWGIGDFRPLAIFIDLLSGLAAFGIYSSRILGADIEFELLFIVDSCRIGSANILCETYSSALVDFMFDCPLDG